RGRQRPPRAQRLDDRLPDARSGDVLRMLSPEPATGDVRVVIISGDSDTAGRGDARRWGGRIPGEAVRLAQVPQRDRPLSPGGAPDARGDVPGAWPGRLADCVRVVGRSRPDDSNQKTPPNGRASSPPRLSSTWLVMGSRP